MMEYAQNIIDNGKIKGKLQLFDLMSDFTILFPMDHFTYSAAVTSYGINNLRLLLLN